MQHWEIKRLNFKGAVRVSLRTARGLCVDIKVHNDGCSLIVNTEGEHATPSEIRHLVGPALKCTSPACSDPTVADLIRALFFLQAGRKFGARQIFEELAHAGLNFLLTDADAARINSQSKARALSEAVNWDIAHAAGPARFFMSKWNAGRPASEVVFNVAAAEAEHYDTIRVEVDADSRRGTKYSVLQVKENKSKFSRKLMQNEVTHARLQNALASRFSADALSELENNQAKTATIETLQRVLGSINLYNSC